MKAEEKIEQLIIAQGWSETTIKELLFDYISNQKNDAALLDYLRTRAEETPTAAARISMLIDEALTQDSLDEDAKLNLAIQILNGSECCTDNDGQYVIYTGQYKPAPLEDEDK